MGYAVLWVGRVEGRVGVVRSCGRKSRWDGGLDGRVVLRGLVGGGRMGGVEGELDCLESEVLGCIVVRKVVVHEQLYVR